jgi:hypothetical protein
LHISGKFNFCSNFDLRYSAQNMVRDLTEEKHYYFLCSPKNFGGAYSRRLVHLYKPELHYGVWSIVLITIDVFDIIHSVSLVGLFSALWG